MQYPNDLRQIEEAASASVIANHLRQRCIVFPRLVGGKHEFAARLVLVNGGAALVAVLANISWTLSLIVLCAGFIMYFGSWQTRRFFFEDLHLYAPILVIATAFVLAGFLLTHRVVRGALELCFDRGAIGPVLVIHEVGSSALDRKECVACTRIDDEWVVLARGVGPKRVKRLINALRDAGAESIEEITVVRRGEYRHTTWEGLLWGVFRRRRLRVRADGSVEWLDRGPR